MNLEEKARELGRFIGQSTEYQAVKRATDALYNDRDASTLLRQMEQLQRDAQQMIERGEQPTRVPAHWHPCLPARASTTCRCACVTSNARFPASPS